MTAVAVDNLTKRFGDFAAVENVSFEVPAGQVLAVLGPNGAGKTTTLEILEGFVAPTSGTVRVLGSDPRRGGRGWRSRIGLVLQSTSLDPELTVAGTLALYGSLYPRAWRVDEMLEMIDLTDDAQTQVGVLSGGQRRRVDVAIGIIGRPEVLFLDEPTTGLDPEARRHMWAAVNRLTQAGTTVLLTTHYIDEADHLADRVIVLAGGRIVTDTTPEGMRAQGGPSTIRCRVPTGADTAELADALACHLEPDTGALRISSDDLAGSLRELLAWADRHQLELTGLEVGPPSLEDAYLTAIGQPLAL
ncbi:MAG: ABC transporter ATP-binding protein [Solirubrobacterales bacterium]|nr:ABC transporter ATP-binding protein [Solirubrobacterales bacterium]